MKRSKNINMFLMDGDVTGKIKCTLSNWIGVIYKVPRLQLLDLKDRPDMKQSGIYFLFGRDDSDKKDTAYIGQATNRKNGEGVLLRVQEHTRDAHSDYFNDVVILTTQNNSFGPTEISYLENHLTQLANDANRFTIRNSYEPNLGNVTEEKQSELDEVIENAITIIGALGYRLFVPLVDSKVSQDNDSKSSVILYLSRFSRKSKKQIEARCQQTTEGFVVLAGSEIDLEVSKSIPKSIQEKRDILLAGNVIEKGILKEDQLFSSPSYASAFVLGMSSNGRMDWKDKIGRSLKEIEELL